MLDLKSYITEGIFDEDDQLSKIEQNMIKAQLNNCDSFLKFRQRLIDELKHVSTPVKSCDIGKNYVLFKEFKFEDIKNIIISFMIYERGQWWKGYDIRVKCGSKFKDVVFLAGGSSTGPIMANTEYMFELPKKYTFITEYIQEKSNSDWD